MNDSSLIDLSRMDWGFGNPNKTAALIVLIMMSVWVLAYVRRWGFWAGLTLFTGFGVCLILTQSRGGLIGMIVGGLILLVWTPRPFPFWRSLAVIIACMALVIFALVINAESRYTKGFSGEDRSVENRLLIWQQVPSMIHDAPNGWGLGKSGDAYMQWYQPVNRGEGYRTLVNSHLTWLAELSWWGRVVYVVAWTTVFVLLWPCRNYRWFSIPFGIWVALAICASFSSVTEVQLLWIVPILALAGVLITRIKKNAWPEPRLWLCGGMASLLIIGGILLWGKLASASSHVYSPQEGVVTLGTKSPKIWIIVPNRTILGEHYGHEIRRGYDANVAYQRVGIGIVSELKNAPNNEILVFSGRVPSSCATLNPSQVILINPRPVTADQLQVLTTLPYVTVIIGEYSQNRDYWSEQARSFPNIKLWLVQGSEEYIVNWMQELANTVIL